MKKEIHYQIEISAPRSKVWKAWTTEEGAKTFFASACKIDFLPGGAYEMYFNRDAPPGEQGGEGMIILAIQPEEMFSFTWNAPPALAQVRGQMTHVTLFFEETGKDLTQLTLVHDGWGEGGEWDQAFDYFTRAWGDVVLPRLKYRFETGPIDWKNPPELGSRAG